MRFPFVKSYHCALPILCLMVGWYLCAGAPLSFKGDNGKTETITVVNGTKEKRLPCVLRTDSASYRWYKNGQIITSNGVKYRIKKQTYLKIKNIRFSDQGDYVCVVSNAEDEVNKTIHLIVTGNSHHLPESGKAPYFTHKEEMIAEQEFDEEKPPILVCNADGNPKPTVVWYKDDERVTSKSEEISADRFTLRLKSPDEKSKSTYSCFVSNKYGNLTYEFVIEVPEITRSAPIVQVMKNQTVVVGGRLNVECRAAARKQPEFNLVELLPNGSLVPVEIGGKIKRRLVQPQDENEVTWHSVWWDFENVSFADQKYYACTAKNRISVAKRKFYVFVTPKVSPNPPTPYKLKKVSETQRNSIIGIICTIIVGPAILGVVVCVIITRRRSKHIREASFERYQTKMLEVPDVSSSNPQPSANCWKQISYTPQTHSSRDLEMLMVASDTATEYSAKTQSLQESLV